MIGSAQSSFVHLVFSMHMVLHMCSTDEALTHAARNARGSS